MSDDYDWSLDDDDYDYGDQPPPVIVEEPSEEKIETCQVAEAETCDLKAEEVFAAYKSRICEDEKERQLYLDLPELPEKIEPWDPYEETYDDEIELKIELESIALPVIDPGRTQLAYGLEALPKLNREIRGFDLITRQTALIQLCSYLYNPEHIERAKKCGVIDTLKIMLSDKDKLVRIKASECIKVIAAYSYGLYLLLSASILLVLSKLLDDECMAARQYAHITMRSLATIPQGVRAILHNKLVSKLLEKLSDEKNFMQAIILDTLHFCLMDDVRQALESDAMNIFKSLLTHQYPIIRAKTARNILDLSVFLQGKTLACSTQTVPALIKLLNDDDHPLVKAKAAAALMMITVITKGKYTALDNRVIEAAIPLLEHDKFEIRLNVLKLLTNVSEAPIGRQNLLAHVPKVSPLIDDSHPSVQEAAKIALRVIQWKHTCL